VQVTLEGIREALARFVSKKVLFTVDMLGVVVWGAKKRNTLASVRLVTACLVSFVGFVSLMKSMILAKAQAFSKSLPRASNKCGFKD